MGALEKYEKKTFKAINLNFEIFRRIYGGILRA
jgi:hypothetical protein